MWLLKAIGRALRERFRRPRYADELDDDAFYERYYGKTDIPRDIPIRVREVCVACCGRRWLTATPEDVPLDDEIDFVDLMDEVADEFGIPIPNEDVMRMDGSFDSIVRYVAGRIRPGA